MPVISLRRARVRGGEFLEVVKSLLTETLLNWRHDNVSRLAASFAFYASFSLAPALVIGLVVAGAMVGDIVAQSRLTDEIQQYLGPQATSFITETISAWRGHMTGSSATAIGVGASLFGATAAFVELQSAFNIIWRTETNRRSFIKQALYERVVAFVVVLGIGIFLLISLFLGATVEVLSRFVADRLPLPASLFHWVNLLVTLVLTTLLVAALFGLLPDRKLRWGDVWLGAIATSILLTVGKSLIAMYFARTAVSSLYGAAGSFAVILLWIYYCAHVLFFGAELAHAYAKLFGSDMAGFSSDAPQSAAFAEALEEEADSRGTVDKELSLSEPGPEKE